VIEGVLVHATGTLEGTIAEAPRGTNGFGYDPIFIPRGSLKTFAEMSSAEKNKISHRTVALHDLMTQVKAHGIVFAKP
jgi:XTP/dITP diphosphohydrolase